MIPERHPRRRVLYYIIALGLLLGVVCWVVAASSLAPREEEMVLQGAPVHVEYAATVSADDLMLPFYPGAKLEQAFAYMVKTKEGKEVAYYASALLTSSDPPEKVAASYQAQLPGQSKPELVEDKSGKRYVLAVASKREVREVTVVPHEMGSRIQLIRATRPTLPPKPLRPRSPQERAT